MSGTDVYRFANGAESNVAVAHDSDACQDCVRIYNDPKTGNPRIFKISELLANEGSNYQRPWRRNAKPVIPPLHPGCFGRLRYVPAGWGWSAQGKFTLVDPEQSLASVKEEIPVKKAHELLNRTTSNSYVPTDEQIAALAAEDIPTALEKVDALKQMHADNYELWHQLDELETKIHFQSAQLRKLRQQDNSNE
jgi:hypothetical protein